MKLTTILAGVFLATSLAVAQTVSVQLTCRSLQMQPATFTSPVPGVGLVTAYFTTYNPARTPRYDTRGGLTYFSGEVRPRSGQSGTYETDYLIIQGNLITEYGSLVMNLATTDSNGYGLPDLLEISRSSAIGITGSARSDLPSGFTYSVSGSWNRPSAQTTGTYAITLALTAGGTGSVSLRGNLNIVATVPTSSSATYVRSPSGTLTFNISFPASDGSLTSSTFSAPFTVPNENSISIPAFSFVDSNGDRYQVQAATLARNGKTYAGNLRLNDGQPQTSWADYLDWYLEITDNNDSDGDGIPDLSDGPNVAPGISTQPVSRSVTAGSATSFSVGATGSTPLTYQWYLNDTPLTGATAATLAIGSVGSLNTGIYFVAVKNQFGETSSDRVTLAIAVPAPSVVTQPQGTTLAIGASTSLTALVAGTNLAYQWFLNDTPILGANSTSYTLDRAQPWMAGAYKVRASNSGGTATSVAVSVSVGSASSTTPTEKAPRLVNISTRGFVGTGAEAIVIGFVTTGGSSQQLLVRASGPALAGFGVQGVLADPQLKIYNNRGQIIQTNDNWSAATAAAAQSVGAFPFPNGSKDAALAGSFSAGAYTMEITDVAGGTGIGLVEAYDLDSSNQQVRLANISTRGLVRSGDSLIAGLVVSGTTPRRILIRGVGPTLTLFGLSSSLPDPVLSVYDGSGRKLFENDDWSTQENAEAIQATATKAGAFPLLNNSRDATILAYVPPGAYTFVVTGKGASEGIALIEAYDLEYEAPPVTPVPSGNIIYRETFESTTATGLPAQWTVSAGKFGRSGANPSITAANPSSRVFTFASPTMGGDTYSAPFDLSSYKGTGKQILLSFNFYSTAANHPGLIGMWHTTSGPWWLGGSPSASRGSGVTTLFSGTGSWQAVVIDITSYVNARSLTELKTQMISFERWDDPSVVSSAPVYFDDLVIKTN